MDNIIDLTKDGSRQKELSNTAAVEPAGITDPRDSQQIRSGLQPDFTTAERDSHEQELDNDKSERAPKPKVEDPSRPSSPRQDPTPMTDVPEEDPAPRDPPLESPTDPDTANQGEARF